MTTGENRRIDELYEFGPFRVDPARETLLKEGVAVPLTPKTFQILLVLVRHGKEIVTKDDLMTTVWPDTFVEEANLSRNIFMLRKALGETAQEHRYIVTVPGRGYRLAENVNLVPGQDFAIAAATHSTVHIDVKENSPWKWIALAAVILLAIAAGLWRLLSHRRAVLSAKDTVVLADFANSTGDPVFDETLRQGLAIQLRQSPFLSLISDQRIAHTLRLMGQRPDARFTPEVARGVCERTGSAAIMEGSIAPLGSQYVVTLQARSCGTGEVLDQEQVQAAKKEDVLNALGQIASRFRNRVGESLTTIQEHNTPLAEATTPSLEALEAYSAGWKIHTAHGAMAALPLLKRAVEIDPNFALAQATLGREYADLDESDLSAESTARAWQSRDHASDRERFYITATYHGLSTGNLEKARQNDEAWAEAYPRDPVPRSMLAGYPNKAAGRYQQAIVEARRAVKLDPDFAIGYYNLGVNNVYLDRVEEAENVLRRAAGQGLEIDEFIMLAHDIAFLKGDQAGMERAIARARERSGGDTWISNKEAYALAYSGQLKKARALSQRATDQAMQESQPERAGLWQAGASLREAFFGNATQARQRATAALNHSNNREVEFGAALALAISGDVGRAHALADDLEKRFPEDTVVRFSYLPVLRARLVLNQGNASQAIELLQVAGPYELGASRLLFGALYPIYVRGEANLAAHHGVEAAVEFQKILDHRGVVGSDPIGALAHLQLGRALALSGEKTKAKTPYHDFLSLWKDADPDVPILKQARVEYANLD
ncbi:MAG TPA: winged helix-turn-helix domain-containing protein [Acidobacteriaceae bacterium]|nr:winged helix-turn-helix domain-containing protein [Acidobacteriaceae bacterium]